MQYLDIIGERSSVEAKEPRMRPGAITRLIFAVTLGAVCCYFGLAAVYVVLIGGLPTHTISSCR